MKNLLAITVILMFVLFPSYADATPSYSERSGQSCMVCHVDGIGGKLTHTGLEFAASGYVYPPTSGYRVLNSIQKPVRFFIGLIHLLTAFMWFGTILYVHILLKPAYAEKGLPRGEVKLGIASMIIMGITGVLLTISKIKSIDVLFSSPWGITLSIKIFFYLIMVSSAVLMVLFVGPRLKRKPPVGGKPFDCVYNKDTLTPFNGLEGRECFIAYDGQVYDVTESELWKEGKHMMRHVAGTDLSKELKNAPHGFEKLENLKVVGTYNDTGHLQKTTPQKIFYFVAYMNLTLVFLVLITIAFWRWGI